MRAVLPMLTCLLVACAGSPPVSVPAPPLAQAEAGSVSAKLQRQYEEWHAVAYREGGQSKRGVDCSGFVQLTFQRQFGRQIPRSTELQARAGRQIRETDRRPGDLVFFKTGLFTRHVGIYMGQGRFLHASKSRGVTLSAMDNPYWSKTYWQSRRLW